MYTRPQGLQKLESENSHDGEKVEAEAAEFLETETWERAWTLCNSQANVTTNNVMQLHT